ncbi:MAG: hypothetical protein DRJ40_11790 [Thermoprotei archaeon]|nr:MAG: hypothetical protein DRJ40_11790 [Thermoprotei archaeon]
MGSYRYRIDRVVAEYRLLTFLEDVFSNPHHYARNVRNGVDEIKVTVSQLHNFISRGRSLCGGTKHSINKVLHSILDDLCRRGFITYEFTYRYNHRKSNLQRIYIKVLGERELLLTYIRHRLRLLEEKLSTRGRRGEL